ncbi:MAG: PqqD family protein [Candidatus Helarchaeota archaeon]
MKLKEDVEIEEKEAYISRELGAVLINYETNIFYETNDTATFIIKQIQEGKNQEAILKAILREYDIDETTATADLTQFLNILKRLELIEE